MGEVLFGFACYPSKAGAPRLLTDQMTRATELRHSMIDKRVIMPTRAEILDTLAASQTQVLAFFHGLSPQDLERPATTSEVPGAAPWRAKDHFAHLVKSERNIQRLLRRTLAGDTRDVLLRSQYPAGMEMP